MSKLTEEMVIARSRQSDLSSIKKLNCWYVLSDSILFIVLAHKDIQMKCEMDWYIQ